jgi:hypothetical protein
MRFGPPPRMMTFAVGRLRLVGGAPANAVS